MSRSLTIFVPLSWVRTDTIPTRHKTLGYAILNDPASTDNGPEPILLPSKLTMPIFANLTIGALSGQGTASDGCPSVIVFKRQYGKDTTDTLEQRILDFCSSRGISKAKLPTLSQAADLVRVLGIPLQYGPAVVRDMLDRVYSRILRIPGTGSSGGLGQKATVDAILAFLRQSGVFDHPKFEGVAVPSSSSKSGVPPLFDETPLTPSASKTPIKDLAVVESPTAPNKDRYTATHLFTPPSSPIRSHLHQGVSIGQDSGHSPSNRIHQEARTREAADIRLHKDITNEAAVRASEDLLLLERIRGEQSIRAEGVARLEQQDATLLERLRGEESIRSAEDAKIQQRLGREIEMRVQEDQRLQKDLATALKRQEVEESTRAAQDAQIQQRLRREIELRAQEDQRLEKVQADIIARQRNEETTRATQDAAIQQRLAREVKSRTEEHTDIINRQRIEETTRAAQDAEIQQRLGREIEARTQDTTRISDLESSNGALWDTINEYLQVGIGEHGDSLHSRITSLEATVREHGGNLQQVAKVVRSVLSKMLEDRQQGQAGVAAV